jgi:anti-anti-sigma regulatory factor
MGELAQNYTDDRSLPCRVVLQGEYDLSRKAELEGQLAAVPLDRDLLLDLREVVYVDSTFLNQLAMLYRRREPSTSITIHHASERVRHLLHVVEFDKLFCVAERASELSKNTL